MKFLWLILMVVAFTTMAQEMYPKGCSPWVIHDTEVILSNKQPAVMMLHNLSDSDLWITHVTTDNNPGVQAGFSSLLQAGKWSALTFSEPLKAFALKCIESKPGHEQPIPCADVLAICQWGKSKLPASAAGIFWAGENMDFNPLKAYVERRGFVLEVE